MTDSGKGFPFNKAVGAVSNRELLLNIIIGITAVSALIWLATHCPTCHSEYK